MAVRRRLPGRYGHSLPTHIHGNSKDKGSSSSLILICIILSAVVGYAGFSWYSHIQLKRMLYTPLSMEKVIVDQPDMKRYWGTYRPQVYFGMKTLSENSIVTGMMWLQQNVRYSNDLPLRHTCEQGDRLSRYGWIAHDGLNFGIQDIVEKNFNLRTEFVKKPGGNHGGDWTWRVSARSFGNNVTLSLFFYAATDQEGDLTPLTERKAYGERLVAISGFSPGLGPFTIKFPKSTENKKQEFHYTVTEVEGLHKLKDGVLRKLAVSEVSPRGGGGKKVPRYSLVQDEFPGNVKNPKSKMLVHQVTMETPFEVEVIFESSSVEQRTELTGSSFTNLLTNLKMKFDQKFESRFPLHKLRYDAEQISFAKAAFSNMIGGIGYFHGNSLVQSEYEVEPVPYWKTGLLTGVPSRSFFPRGFLWDEGFHELLISKWDRELSLSVIGHWLDTMNAEGWIPREQILGDEARSKVPDEFVVQRNTNANPPTFFLTLQSIVRDMKSQRKGMTENEKKTLTRMFPKLQAWFSWFNRTQSGPIPGSYRWRGREENSDRELNPKTLTSGLDDYPRSSHPNQNERHVDLRCWIALASETLSNIAAEIGEDPTEYKSTSDYLMDNNLLNKLHWSEGLNSYSDFGNHSAKVVLVQKQIPPTKPGLPVTFKVVRETRSQPKQQLVNAKGYITLFPFLLHILEPNSPQLLNILQEITDPNLLWTDFGLRSLSKTDPLYMKRNTEHDPPYWRGQIWININFLAVRALKHYATVSPPPVSELADQIYTKLRANLVNNIFRQYKNTGYIWENYNDNTGAGQGCHPFTGWSALVVLIMSEQYGS
ncbi:mannosyl-oligosaccharide glucosidase-like [Styela clava]